MSKSEEYQYVRYVTRNNVRQRELLTVLPADIYVPGTSTPWLEEAEAFVRVRTGDVINPEHYNSVFYWMSDFSGDEMGYDDPDMIVGVYRYETIDIMDPTIPLIGTLEINMETNKVLGSTVEREE